MVKCRNCGRELPEGSSFCPVCGASVSSPHAPVDSEDKKCPKCGTAMRAGFIVERESPLSLWTYGSGVYWTPGEAGMIGERVAVKAYACPQCGYIEHYIRYLDKDKGTILSAPTRFRE